MTMHSQRLGVDPVYRRLYDAWQHWGNEFDAHSDGARAYPRYVIESEYANALRAFNVYRDTYVAPMTSTVPVSGV